MSRFYVGQLVQCVRACETYNEAPCAWEPKVGGVYKVRQFFVGQRGIGRVNFMEDLYFDPSIGFRASRFRALIEGPDNAELIERIRACKPITRKVGA